MEEPCSQNKVVEGIAITPRAGAEVWECFPAGGPSQKCAPQFFHSYLSDI